MKRIRINTFSSNLSLFLSLLLTSFLLNAKTSTVKIEDGLPSNVVYQTLEDNAGFLWIATDQGIVRYDGKQMQLFAKAQGVPDIEVLQIAKEKNGRIWIRCYNNRVAYFNSIQNRFIDITEIARFMNINAIKRMNTLMDGGIVFETENCSYVFNPDETPTLPIVRTIDHHFLIKQFSDQTSFQYSFNEKDSSVQLIKCKGSEIIERRSLPSFGSDLNLVVNDGVLYIFKRRSSTYYVVKNVESSLQSISIETRILNHAYYMHSFTSNYLNLFYRSTNKTSGKDIMDVNVYDKFNGKFLFELNEQCIAFHLFEDKNNTKWVSTLDQGLIAHSSDLPVKQLFDDENKNVKFFSLMKGGDGRLFAGNEKGEVVESMNHTPITHTVNSKGKVEWQRNLAYSQQKMFAFSDGGIYVNYTKEIKTHDGKGNIESKAILILNDSTILNGSTSGLGVLNTKLESYTSLNNVSLVVTSLASIDQQHIYIGTTDGLFLYDIKSSNLQDLNQSQAIFKQRIVAMCTTSDSLLWIATATDGLMVLKDSKLVAHLNEVDGLNSNNTMALTKGSTNQVWVGTSMGVCRINYTISGKSLSYSIQNISLIDGLSSTIINQLLFDKNQLYVATDQGVNIVPNEVPIPSIDVSLVGVQINQRDTIVAKEYELASNQRNITLQFAGVDLHGYFKQVMYSLDEGQSWAILEGSKLSLEQNYGQHSIWVKAIDVNKHISDSILKLQLNIETPYWKRWWFWTIISILIQILIGYAIYKRYKRREKQKQERELAKAHLASLEQQAFVSLMNPHFMFNALNSIQHYINHQDRQNANRFLSDFASLIRKNFEAAQQAFIPLEQEMENISLYLRLERMRFNDKFLFEIEYMDDMDPEDWMMPTMIMQPLVENSILHGLMPSDIAGKLILRLSIQQKDLLIEVIDNGIGVENSRALKQGSTHKSRGMELIHKRLLALSFFSTQELKLVNSIPYVDERNPGNKTSLMIPYDLYSAWKEAQRTSNK